MAAISVGRSSRMRGPSARRKSTLRVRRPYRKVIPGSCSTNVRCEHSLNSASRPWVLAWMCTTPHSLNTRSITTVLRWGNRTS